MLGRPNTALSQIHMQIMWSRLIAVVEEQAQTLVRTAFSTTVREAGDLSAGVFDRDGNMLAQAVTGTPGHVNSMAAAVKHFLDAFPLKTMRPGDHYITNDPWLTCGHLHDLTVVSPTFLRGEPVGLFASTVHVVDIGGLGMGPDGRQVFEEGLSIPLMALAREGRMNDDLLRVIRANVREPLQVEGDVYALAACNDEGSRRLVEMMEEFGIANLDRLGEHIIETSRQATIEAIGKLKKGSYRNSLTMDGYDRPLTLAAEMTIGDDGIHVDYTGTSPASAFGINVVLELHDRLHRVRGKVPRCSRGAEQCRFARPDHGQRAGGLSVEREAAARRRRPAHGRPHAARCRVRLPASGHGGRRAGRRGVLAVDPADLRRRRCARRARRGGGQGAARHQAVQHGDFPLRRRRCAAGQGRARRDRVPVRRAHDPGRGDRVGGAGDVPPARVPRGLGRRRAISRRPRPDHRTGRRRRHADRDAVQFRAHLQPGARP